MAAISCLMLAGCAGTSATNKHWWNPATWLSDSEASRLERKDHARDVAREKVIKAAQITAHETDQALAAAPASPPVDVAREASAETIQLLDQAAGPLTADEMAKVRKQITALLSENAELRSTGERLREHSRSDLADLSSRLAAAEIAREKAAAALPDALRREASTANKYRNLLFGFWAAVSLAVLAGVAWIYVRYFTGGFAGLVGKALARADTHDPVSASAARKVLDDVMSLKDQARVAKHHAKAALKQKTA